MAILKVWGRTFWESTGTPEYQADVHGELVHADSVTKLFLRFIGFGCPYKVLLEAPVGTLLSGRWTTADGSGRNGLCKATITHTDDDIDLIGAWTEEGRTFNWYISLEHE